MDLPSVDGDVGQSSEIAGCDQDGMGDAKERDRLVLFFEAAVWGTQAEAVAETLAVLTET